MATAKKPLNHLLQGDVGCGKTVVVLLLALNVIKAGYQVAFLAPTQILAQQHLRSCQELLGQFLKPEEVGLFTSDLKSQQQAAFKERLLKNEIKLAIGTHSLFNKTLLFKKLALIIIDEQHFFWCSSTTEINPKSSAGFK